MSNENVNNVNQHKKRDGADVDGRDGRGRTGRTGRTWTDGTGRDENKRPSNILKHTKRLAPKRPTKPPIDTFQGVGGTGL